MPSAWNPTPTAPATGVLLAAATTTAAAVALGAVYSLAIWYIPLVNLVTLAAAPAYGFGIALTGDHALKRGRVRHEAAGMAVVMSAAVLGLYASWIVWVGAVTGTFESLSLAVEPLELMRTIAAINEAGPWEVRGWKASGFELWVLWIVEAGLILGVARWVAREHIEALLATPFCESCKSWVGPTVGIANFGLGDDEAEEVRSRVVAGEWEYFETLGISPDEDNGHHVFAAHCSCGRVESLTVERNTHREGGAYGCEVLVKSAVMDEGEGSRVREAARRARRGR